MGVTVTFSAILELMKEGLIEIVQAEPYAPLHVRPASGSRHLTVVSDNDAIESSADAENEAALAQPAQPDENEIDDEEDDLLIDGDVEAVPAEEDSGSQDQSSDVAPSAEHSESTEASVADVHEDSLEVSVEASGEASERLESAETDSVTEELQSHEHVEDSDEESKRE
jgi:segregation and condensation protein A